MGTAPPRVSVILPTYNREHFVVEAVASVLGQTLADFEILVVDDGSTDRTGEAVRDRFGRDPRLVYLRREHGGAAAARNLGLDRARGDHVALLDSDDLFLPEHLANQVACLADHPEAALSVCDARYEGPWDRGAGTIFADRRFRPPTSLEAMLAGAWTIPSCMTFRRGDVAGLRFHESYSYCADTELLFRFFVSGRMAVLNPRVLAAYRRHDGSRGHPQLIDDTDLLQAETLRILEAYAAHAADPRVHRGRIFQQRRKLAKRLVEKRRWRTARPHLWAWVKARPTSTRALRWWLRSWL